VTCPFCDSPLPVGKKRWCSDKCKYKVHAQNQRAKRSKKEKRQGVCVGCGDVFTGTAAKKYCSVKCYPRRAASRHNPILSIVATCTHCQAKFHPMGKDRITYCSRACHFAHRKELKSLRQAARHAKRLTREEDWKRKVKERSLRLVKTCVGCGVQYQRKGSHGTCPSCLTTRQQAKTNSPEMKEWRRAYNKARRAKKMHDRGKHYVRARKYGVPYESIKPAQVFERDGWQCRLCNQPIDRTAKAPHPLSASLDHVIPMARGGPHTYTNVQTAHFRCNSAKGARIA
jgi:hypothetical protein